jgi:O-antigen/teichoic acid export membrane protein
MSQLISRGVILTISRVSNYAILLISPLVLVRILDVEAFGQYREFILYAMILITISRFTIDSSLTYFIPKYPSKERSYVTQATILVLLTSGLCASGILIFGDVIIEHTSWNFVVKLAAYVFCFVNLNEIEFYWIAKKRTDFVLYYSAARVLMRVAVLLSVAYVTRNVDDIVTALIAVETLRLIFVFCLMSRLRLFTSNIQKAWLSEQLKFVAPLGLAQIVQQVSRDIGKIIIVSFLGPASLALYSVGSYLLPIIYLLRGSIGDVLFPEIVRKQESGQSAIELWRRATVMYCVVMFPAFVILTYFAEPIISTLFTPEYVSATVVFQIYALVILRRSFNFDILLRAAGTTAPILTGGFLQLIVSAVLSITFFRIFGFIGPAMAFVIADLLMELYYARRVTRSLETGINTLVNWLDILRVTVSCALCAPFLLMSEIFPGPVLVEISLSSALYVTSTTLAAWILGVKDIGILVNFARGVSSRLLGVLPRSTN